ncbi:MAG TPA: ABC-2 transporter permease [Pelotomaculum sp.]|nr:ABC-2 transporter permease [Pelotomaculum sp.]
MFNLVKKDFLLVKKYLALTVVLAFGIPLFVAWQAPGMMGFAVFLITVIFTVYIPLQSVSLAEAKYPKATALLCTAPYRRSAVVKARYVFFLIIFIFCCLAYAILSLLAPQMEMLSTMDVVITFLIFSIVFGIYIPLQYKFGFEKTKYLLMVLLFATSFLMPSIVKMFAHTNINLDIFTGLPLPVRYAALITVILIVISISLTASIKTFQAKAL